MKTKLILFCSALFLLSHFSGSAQTGFSTQVQFLKDTSYMGAIDTVIVWVKNMDTAAYTGYVNVYYATDTVAFSPLPLCSLGNVGIPGLDSIQINCTIDYDSTYFNQGGNIVVVWSSGSAKMPDDSVYINIYLDPNQGAGVHQTDLSSGFHIYPTLTHDVMYIEAVNKTQFPKKIFVEDVSGRVVRIIPVSVDSKNRIKINTSELLPGVYFLDMLLPDQQRLVAKFVKVE